MNELFQESIFFGVLLSMLSYGLGVVLRKKWNKAFLNPLLIAVTACILFLTAFHIDYAVYEQGAKYLSYFLTPATVCLAIPLYEQLTVLKQNWKAVFLGIFSGVLTSLCTILALSCLFGLNHKEYVTLLPKSITTAIGMGVTEELGGYVTICVAVIILTGIWGNIIAETLCRLLHIHHPIAKGIAIGSSAHAIGTARAMEMGVIEGAMSSLSIAVAGILTVIAAPFFALFL